MATFGLHFHELALKGGNRSRFERALRNNARRALAEIGPCETRSYMSRVLVTIEADVDPAVIQRRLAQVCGVSYVLRLERLPRDMEAVGRSISADLAARPPGTFRISTRRVDKTFPLLSMEADRDIGAVVVRETGRGVQLKGAAYDYHVSVLKDEVLVGLDRVEGPGGLPVGTGGRVAALMSGGIDSPVAAWRMINRGCHVDLVHFHSFPLVDRTTQEKARDLAETLTRWQYRTRLHMVPLAPIQREIRLHCPEALRVVLYRRFMLRIAERIARGRRCGALVTGESLGQVASQTLENLSTVDAVAQIPVLRPLIGTDKREIIDVARRIGTFDISIRPDQDCCQLFVPNRPATKTTRTDGDVAEADLDVAALVEEAVAAATSEDLIL